MDRLTDRSKEMPTPISDHEAYYARCVNKLADYEDTGLEPLEVDTMNTALCGWCHNYERLVEITNAESEGRLIVRPGTVYQTDGVNIYESAVRKIIYDTGHFAFDDDAIGCSVFLTREEAEAAMGGAGDA